ncbi:hypothetical protein KA005_29285 [bacterium]|nr:hypothetical protein [bacterium]
MAGFHQCLGEDCTKWITYRFAICAKCEERYGKSARNWPSWLRFLWNDIQRNRRRNKRISMNEITFADLEDDNDR